MGVKLERSHCARHYRVTPGARLFFFYCTTLWICPHFLDCIYTRQPPHIFRLLSNNLMQSLCGLFPQFVGCFLKKFLFFFYFLQLCAYTDCLVLFQSRVPISPFQSAFSRTMSTDFCPFVLTPFLELQCALIPSSPVTLFPLQLTATHSTFLWLHNFLNAVFHFHIYLSPNIHLRFFPDWNPNLKFPLPIFPPIFVYSVLFIAFLYALPTPPLLE